nr:hypothetical protein [Streptomyces sp. TRM68416]
MVGGAFLFLAGGLYAGDAGDLWETPWFAVIPLVTAGLGLAAATALVARGIRRRRRADRTGAGAETDGVGATPTAR